MAKFSDADDIGEAIEGYRRRRERVGNIVIVVLALLAALTGIALIVMWLGGSEGIAMPSFLLSETPTPTATSTFTITPTLTLVPTVETPTVSPTPQCPAEYEIQVGDTISAIADKCGLEMLVIIALNPEVGDGSNIQPGQKIKIPPPGTGLTPTEIATEKAREVIEILVEPGDTLQSIADRCFSTVDDIIRLNKIKDPNTIFVGAKLKCHYRIATRVPTKSPTPNLPSPTDTLMPTIGPTSTRAD